MISYVEKSIELFIFWEEIYFFMKSLKDRWQKWKEWEEEEKHSSLMIWETEEKYGELKVEKEEENDSLSIEHKEGIHIFHKSMDLLISSILNNNNNNNNNMVCNWNLPPKTFSIFLL